MINAVKIDFAKMDGLVPGMVQDAKTGEMLMLGFLNEVSYAKTLESGFVTFWSRTRQKLWMKGETSGNRLRVIEAATDCDNDALLFKVRLKVTGWFAMRAPLVASRKILQWRRSERTETVEAGHTQGQSAGRNDCAV